MTIAREPTIACPPAARLGATRRCSLCGRAAGLSPAALLPDFLWSTAPTPAPTDAATHAGTARRAAIGDYAGVAAPRPEALLCGACQCRLTAWDDYARDALACASVRPRTADARSLTIDGLDYKRFKLFQLSVLWRAGISRDPFFRHVKLGPHEGKLRRMLLGDDPGPADAYPVMLFLRHPRLSLRPSAPLAGLSQPVCTTLGGRRSYRFAFGLLDWVFTVSSERLPDDVQAEALQPSGRLALRLAPIASTA